MCIREGFQINPLVFSIQLTLFSTDFLGEKSASPTVGSYSSRNSESSTISSWTQYIWARSLYRAFEAIGYTR